MARFERVDSDITGFRSWVGAIDGIEHSHVVITERPGIVSGLINAVGVTYQLGGLRPEPHFPQSTPNMAAHGATTPTCTTKNKRSSHN